MRHIFTSRGGYAVVVAVLSTVLVACGRDAGPDAYGNFEATEVVVSAQTAGQLQQFVPVEGMQLDRGALVAVVDTTQLVLERAQLLAQRGATNARRTEVTRQIEVLELQRDISKRAFERTTRLFDEKAATAQQLDQAERDYRTLVAQISAARAQLTSVGMDVASGDARVNQVSDRISLSTVTNPTAGTVLASYARSGEVVQPGRPLYRIANLDTLVLRAYLTGGQMDAVRLGQHVQVNVDRGGDGLRTVDGVVTWISPTAEFTPTPVQTRDERADLVYAVKISVANGDGRLRIGMPGDVTLGPAASVSPDSGGGPAPEAPVSR